MKPCETDVLNPFRRVGDPPRVYVEGGSNANHECRIKSVCMLCHEEFLLGSTETYPGNISVRSVYKFPDFDLFLLRQRSEGRCVGAHHLQFGITAGQGPF